MFTRPVCYGKGRHKCLCVSVNVYENFMFQRFVFEYTPRGIE